MVSGSSEASQSYNKENATKQKHSSSSNQIKKEGKADYFTVEGAAVTSWKSKRACVPCAGAKEGSDGEVSPTQPSQQELGSALNLIDTRCVRGTATGVEMKYHTDHCSSLVPFWIPRIANASHKAEVASPPVPHEEGSSRTSTCP